VWHRAEKPEFLLSLLLRRWKIGCLSFGKTNTVTSHKKLKADPGIGNLDVSDITALGNA